MLTLNDIHRLVEALSLRSPRENAPTPASPRPWIAIGDPSAKPRPIGFLPASR